MNYNDSPRVYVLDPDPGQGAATAEMLTRHGLTVETFSSIDEYRSQESLSRPRCLVVEHQLGGQTALQLQAELQENADSTPLVVLTAMATVALAVRYMQNGAESVLEKPCDAAALLGAVQQALSQDARCYEIQQRLTDLRSSERELTPQERRVMAAVIGGKLNKVIANDLDVSVRTVEKIRARVLRKFRVDNATELAAKATELQVLTERVLPNHTRTLHCLEPRC